MIVKFPDPRLKEISQDIEKTDPIKEIISSLFKVMCEENGIGISAIQIGIAKRIFVMDIEGNQKIFINPKIISVSEDIEKASEGCLSFPGIFTSVSRPSKIIVSYLDANFNLVEEELESLEAVCFQHELDHLNGITFFDHMSRLKKEQTRKKLLA